MAKEWRSCDCCGRETTKPVCTRCNGHPRGERAPQTVGGIDISEYLFGESVETRDSEVSAAVLEVLRERME